MYPGGMGIESRISLSFALKSVRSALNIVISVARAIPRISIMTKSFQSSPCPRSTGERDSDKAYMLAPRERAITA